MAIFRKLVEKVLDTSNIVKSVELKLPNWIKDVTSRVSEESPINKSQLKFKQGRLPFDVFEKTMMPRGENIQRNGTEGLALGFIDEIAFPTVFPTSELNDLDKALYRNLKRRIYDIVTDTETFIDSIYGTKQNLIDNFSEIDGAVITIQMFDNWKITRNSSLSARDQLIDLRANLQTMYSNLNRVRFSLSNDISVSLNLPEKVSNINDRINIISSLLNEKSSELENLIDNVTRTDEFIEDVKVNIERSNEISGFLANPFFKYVNSDYIRNALSSTPISAQSLNKSTGEVRNNFDSVAGAATPARTASPSPTSGDEQFEETTGSKAESIGPLNKDQWKSFQSSIQSAISGSSSKVNDEGYLGKYQSSATDLIETGYVNPGTLTRALKVDKNWTGKDGISDYKGYLGSSDTQDSVLLSRCQYYYKRLLESNLFTDRCPPAKVAGYVGVAYVQNIDAAKAQAEGETFTDKKGRSNSSLYNQFKGSVGGEEESSSEEQAQEYQQEVTKNTFSNGVPFSIPSSPAAPVYPYNKATETESGHLIENDDTPGSERVSWIHRTGSGTEIGPDGSQVTNVRKDRYTAVLGDDSIIINGQVNIYVENTASIVANNVNIESKENFNVNCGGAFNIKAATMKVDVDGSRIDHIGGDFAEVTEGFRSVAVEGDYGIDSQSITAIARGGDNTFISSENTNMISGEATNINAGTTLEILSGEDMSVSSAAAMALASSSMSIGSDGSLVVNGAGGATIGSSSSLTLSSGGNIKLSHPVEKALYSDDAGIANPGTPVPTNPSGGSVGNVSSSGVSGAQEAKDEKIPESVEKTTTSGITSSQAGARG